MELLDVSSASVVIWRKTAWSRAQTGGHMVYTVKHIVKWPQRNNSFTIAENVITWPHQHKLRLPLWGLFVMLSVNCPIILLWLFKTPKHPGGRGCEFDTAPGTPMPGCHFFFKNDDTNHRLWRNVTHWTLFQPHMWSKYLLKSIWKCVAHHEPDFQGSKFRGRTLKIHTEGEFICSSCSLLFLFSSFQSQNMMDYL